MLLILFLIKLFRRILHGTQFILITVRGMNLFSTPWEEIEPDREKLDYLLEGTQLTKPNLYFSISLRYYPGYIKKKKAQMAQITVSC